jgi:hypothetical protein
LEGSLIIYILVLRSFRDENWELYDTMKTLTSSNAILKKNSNFSVKKRAPSTPQPQKKKYQIKIKLRFRSNFCLVVTIWFVYCSPFEALQTQTAFQISYFSMMIFSCSFIANQFFWLWYKFSQKSIWNEWKKWYLIVMFDSCFLGLVRGFLSGKNNSLEISVQLLGTHKIDEK